MVVEFAQNLSQITFNCIFSFLKKIFFQNSQNFSGNDTFALLNLTNLAFRVIDDDHSEVDDQLVGSRK